MQRKRFREKVSNEFILKNFIPQFCQKHYDSLFRVFEVQAMRASEIVATRELRESVGGKVELI